MELYYKNAEHILRIKPFNEFENINENTKIQLDNIVKQFIKREIQSKSLMIKTMIEHNVDENWVELINNSKILKRDSITLNSFVTRYGKKIGTNLFKERSENFVKSMSGSSYIKKHGIQKFKKVCESKANFGERFFVKKYGKIAGKKKWRSVLSKKLKTQKENFKNKKWKNGRTLDEYQERHGIEDGYKRWVIRNNRQSYMVSLQRYIDEYGKERGSEICKKIKDTNSLSVYIDRYGKSLGEEKYKIFIEKLLAYSENKPNFSKISQEFCWKVYNKLTSNQKNSSKFAELNEEYLFYTGNDLKIIQVDFKCGNKIIEFHGDFWHANPTQYKHDDILHHPNNHIFAEDLWKKDKSRINWLNSKNYDVLEIWESDYNKNKQEVINKCINFINETT